MFLDGIIEAQPVFLDQHHHCERCDRLGHRGYAEDRVGPHGNISRHVLLAKGAGVARAVVVHHHGHIARNAGLPQARFEITIQRGIVVLGSGGGTDSSEEQQEQA
jgi:hypothetical protein